MSTESRYQVGAYYFPNYHVDARNEAVHGPGWSEWELVKVARPRYEGHYQPRLPVWGYVDEARPSVMEMKIAVAADHGLDFWIFDWYWYDDGPYLQRCLEDGYLNAQNNARLKFCCMWANHDWIDIHPAKYTDPRRLLYPGAIGRETFEAIVEHVVGTYFTHPSYFTIDGCPYFSIYELSKLLESFGGVTQTRKALEYFRTQTRATGLPDLHLNAVVWGQPVLPGETAPTDVVQLVRELGFDSVTSYVWIHHYTMPHFPETDFTLVRAAYMAYWEQTEKRFGLPYYPNVTVGWDSSPRTVQSEAFSNLGYPFTPIMTGHTPDRFRESLQMVRDRLEETQGPHILNINAWNEWTEGSYLEPDTVYGLKYLEAIREIFE
ncbi:MAG: glycosyltransferase WbsX family protein [Candidatus Zipacnadales bacterium]